MDVGSIQIEIVNLNVLDYVLELMFIIIERDFCSFSFSDARFFIVVNF